MNNLYDIGQQVYFSSLSYSIANTSLSQSVVSDFKVSKIIVEKPGADYIFSYVLSDESGLDLIKQESHLFATKQACQTYINSTIAAAIATLQNSIS